MKVVINSCFGGFGLSALATKRLAELNGRECYFFTCRQSDGSLDLHKLLPITLEKAEKEFIWHAYDIPNPGEALPDNSNWHEMPLEERKASNRHSIEHRRGLDRHDPKLIQVIEELGDKANGKHAQLTIIEIPDGVDYEIDEYDGSEHIAEKHRTWYASSTD